MGTTHPGRGVRRGQPRAARPAAPAAANSRPDGWAHNISLFLIDEDIAALQQAGITVALFDAEHSVATRVAVDDVHDREPATEHLLCLGHERIASSVTIGRTATGSGRPDAATRVPQLNGSPGHVNHHRPRSAYYWYRRRGPGRAVQRLPSSGSYWFHDGRRPGRGVARRSPYVAGLSGGAV
jgi:hypothetical protein